MLNRRLGYIIRDQDPLVMQSGETVHAAAKAMRERHAGSVLVVDERQHLIGIFTGRDAVKVLARGEWPQTALSKAMTPNPLTVDPDQRAIDALRIMSDGGFRHVPVVEHGRIWGVVSRADFKGMEIDRLDEEEGLAERIR
jgi:CBS domain-containing protein